MRILLAAFFLLAASSVVADSSRPSTPAPGETPLRLVALAGPDGSIVHAYIPWPDPQPPLCRVGAIDITVKGSTYRLSPGIGDDAECRVIREGGMAVGGECTVLVEGERVVTALLSLSGCESVSRGASCLLQDSPEMATRPAR